MDPWKDCLNFSDAVLDVFIRTLPSHPDHAVAVAESERRRREYELQRPVGTHRAPAILLAKAVLIRVCSWSALLLRFSKRQLRA